MLRRVIVLAFCASAFTAAAASHPILDLTYVRVEVGETRTVTVRSWWSGIWVRPWHDWVFDTTNRSVAIADGVMKSSLPYDVRITGVAPGTAYLTIQSYPGRFTQIQVACGTEDPIQPAEASVGGTIGEPVTLRAVTPIAHRTTFAWYHGRVGDLASPLAGSGPEVELTPTRATEYAWVLATTPCSASTAEFHVTAHASRRRTARH